MRSEDRFLLFLDVLGFSDLVKSRGEEEVFATIDALLEETRGWVDRHNFASLYFSDTVVIYSDLPGFSSTFRDDFITIASRMFTALAAKRIPTRAALAFGPFTVRGDSSGDHNVFFGTALVEAAKVEAATKFVGVALCDSFVGHYTPPHLDRLLKTGELGRLDDGRYCVNPLVFLRHLNVPEFVDSFTREFPDRMRPSDDNYLLEREILALDYLRAQVHADLPASVSVKYRRTLDLLQQVMPENTLDWAQEAASSLLRST